MPPSGCSFLPGVNPDLKKGKERCWAQISLLNWNGALTLFLLLKLPARKLER